ELVQRLDVGQALFDLVDALDVVAYACELRRDSAGLIRIVPEIGLRGLFFELREPRPSGVDTEISPRRVNPLAQAREIIGEVAHREAFGWQGAGGASAPVAELVLLAA